LVSQDPPRHPWQKWPAKTGRKLDYAGRAAAVKAYVEDPRPVETIAAEFGISARLLNTYVRDAGVPLRGHRRK
jgi:transposase-like protein